MTHLNLQRAEPIQHQLTRLIREKILSGELPEGKRLPAASVWAKELGTNYFTLHSALTVLAKEGLIERRPRTGSVVCANRSAASMVIGVYCCRSFWKFQHHGAAHMILNSLKRKLESEGSRTRLWLDERPEDAQFEPLPELVQAIRDNEIQGLAVILVNRQDVAWLKKLNVPASFLTGANLPNKIHHDHIQMIQLALDRLVANGCRSVGTISGACPGESERGWQHPSSLFYDDFLAMCKERGLDYRNQWIRSPQEELRSPELYGYMEFQKMWAEKERPDGLFIFPDVVASGVFKAIADLPPETPRPSLVVHRNLGLSLDWPPIKASWIYTDLDRVADGLILQIVEQRKGHPAPNVMIPYAISDNEEIP